MDSFTHALAGSLVADLLPYTKKLGRPAQVAAIAAGMAPDLDLLIPFFVNFPPKALTFNGLFGHGLAELYHRAYTHSIFYTFIGALLLAPIIRRLWVRGSPLWQWFVLIWFAFLSHILLDYTNPWGVRALMPFDNERYALSIMPFFDVTFTGLLILAFIMNHVLRDPYRKEGDPPLRPLWRGRSEAFLDRIAGVGAVSWVFVVLLVARVVLGAYGVFPLPN